MCCVCVDRITSESSAQDVETWSPHPLQYTHVHMQMCTPPLFYLILHIDTDMKTQPLTFLQQNRYHKRSNPNKIGVTVCVLSFNLLPWHKFHILFCLVNLWAPCILYIGQVYRQSPECAFYIFSQQIYLIFFFRLYLAIFVCSSTKCRVFPNVTHIESYVYWTGHHFDS